MPKSAPNKKRLPRRTELEPGPGPVAGLGNRIKQARGIRSQKEVAKRAQITAATLNRYENGKRYPSVVEFQRLCAALGVSPDWILTGEHPGEREYEEAGPAGGYLKPSGDDAADAVALTAFTTMLFRALPKRQQRALQDVILAVATAHFPKEALELLGKISQAAAEAGMSEEGMAPQFVGAIVERPEIRELVESFQVDDTK